MQSAELILWMYAFQYYTYPAALFGSMLFGSGASGYLQYRQRMRLVTLLTKRQLVPVLYKKFVRALLAKQLVPGDVIVVQKGRAACDMVLLRGRCLVEESMLSGEVWELCSNNASAYIVSIALDRRHCNSSQIASHQHLTERQSFHFL